MILGLIEAIKQDKYVSFILLIPLVAGAWWYIDKLRSENQELIKKSQELTQVNEILVEKAKDLQTMNEEIAISLSNDIYSIQQKLKVENEMEKDISQSGVGRVIKW